jgi:hypothetical protein
MVMVRVMNEREEIDKIGGLLRSVTSIQSPFLERCSETKLLAVQDLDLARDRYRTLAQQALRSYEEIFPETSAGLAGIRKARTALESGKIDSQFERTLSGLRSTYLSEVISPALKDYLNKEKGTRKEIQDLYERVLTLDGLLETARFIRRVRSV